MPELSDVVWRKSGFSGASGCVEVAALADDLIAVRDSKDPDGPILGFRRDEWNAFIEGVRDGEFDL